MNTTIIAPIKKFGKRQVTSEAFLTQFDRLKRGSSGNEALRDKLIDVMYENEQLKAENSKLRETLNKAYDFMKQFVVDGRNNFSASNK